MKSYKNLNGNSNVKAYMDGNQFIIIQFMSGENTYYKYTDYSAGASAIVHMSLLAKQGYGLNSYVNTNKPPYVAKGSNLLL